MNRVILLTCLLLSSGEVFAQFRAAIASRQNVSCAGRSDGQVTVRGSGGQPPYSYSIDGITYGRDSTFRELPAGIYTLRVRDNLNDEARVNVTINAPTPIRISNIRTVKPTNCRINDGRIIVSAAGGTGRLSYSLDDDSYQLTGTFRDLGSGMYIVYIKDTIGCSIMVDSIIVESPAAPVTVLFNKSNPTCPGANNGSMGLRVTGSGAPFTYSLDNQNYQETPIFEQLEAGKTYTFYIKDSDGCINTVNETLGFPDTLRFASIRVKHPSCSQNNGEVTLRATGGKAPYRYSTDGITWVADSLITGFRNGIQELFAQDANGCVVRDSVLFRYQGAFNLRVNVSRQPLCANVNDGEIQAVVASGFSEPLEYALNNGTFVRTSSFSNLAPGTYTVHVKDARDCFQSGSATIVSPLPISISADVEHPACGTRTGIIRLTGTGGTGNLLYALNQPRNFSANAVYRNLAAGTFTVYAEDRNGCQSSLQVVLINEANFKVTAIPTNSSCASSPNGDIEIDVTGGEAPYEYSVDGGLSFFNDKVIDGLRAGFYKVVVKDKKGCMSQLPESIYIGSPDSIKILRYRIIQPKCGLNNGGVIFELVHGGVPPYQYASESLETAFGSNNRVDGLRAGGLDTVYVRDANRCTVMLQVRLDDSKPLVIDSIRKGVVRCQLPNGEVTVFASGGKAPYTFSANQSPFTDNNTLTGLRSGFVQLVVRDIDGCEATITDTLKDVTLAFTVTTDVQGPGCPGDNQGTAAVSIRGGKAPFLYLWSNRQTTSAISNLKAGTYTVTITSEENCSKVEIITLTDPAPVEVNLQVVNPKPDVPGVIIANATGGTPPYQYSLNGADFVSSNRFDGLVASEYTIRAQDSRGCIGSATTALTDRIQPLAQLNLQLYPNPATHTVMFKGLNGRKAYVFVIDVFGREVLNTTTTETIDVSTLPAGIYTLKIQVGKETASEKLIIK